MGAGLQKKYLAYGHVLAVVGIIILLLTVLPFATITPVVEEFTDSDVWLTKSFLVPAYSRVWLNESFFLPDIANNYDSWNFSYLLIDFSAAAGGLFDVIDFQVLDEANYFKMRAGEVYQDLGYPSQYGILHESAQWVPPNDTRIYFVWANNFSDNKPRTVSASFTLNWKALKTVEKIESKTLLPSWAAFFGVLVLIIGLLSISYGSVSRPVSARELSSSARTDEK